MRKTEGTDFSRSAYQEWKERVQRELKGRPWETIVARTFEGIHVEPIYPPGVVSRARSMRPSNVPWKIYQRYSLRNLERCAEEIEDDLSHGTDGAWLCFSQDPEWLAIEPRKLAALVDVLAPWEAPFFLEPKSNPLLCASAWLSAMKFRGVNLSHVQGALGVDPLSALMSSGTLSLGLQVAMQQMVDLSVWCQKNAPGVRSVLVSTVAYHNAGAHSVQELAFALSTATEYLRRLTSSGVDVRFAVEQLCFSFAIDSDFFMGIAKLRAARMLWNKIRRACGATERPTNPIHACTSIRGLSQLDVWTNAIRISCATLSAALGGADIISTAPFDELHGAATPASRRLARNTQLVIREEGHVQDVQDAASGSDYMEALTDQLARAAWNEFQRLEAQGGMVRAILGGEIAGALEISRAARLKAFSTKEKKLIGVNKYPNPFEQELFQKAATVPPTENLNLKPLTAIDTERMPHVSVLSKLNTLFLMLDAEPGSWTDAALEAMTLGTGLHSIAKLGKNSRPSLYIEPLPTVRDAEIWEQVHRLAEGMIAKEGTSGGSLHDWIENWISCDYNADDFLKMAIASEPNQQ